MRCFANKTARVHLEAAVESGHKTSRLAGPFFLRWVFWGLFEKETKNNGRNEKKDEMIEMSILIIYTECMKPFWEVFCFPFMRFSQD